MVVIENPEETENALFTYHKKLALIIKDKAPLKKAKTLVEVGSGAGNFTIPFINEINDNFEKFYCIDPFYSLDDLDILKKRIHQHELKEKIEIIRKDARELPDILSSVDLIIGHGVLCVIPRKQIEEVISACYQVLKDGGLFIHSEHSPFTLNEAEQLFYKLNEYTSSPVPDELLYTPKGDELAGAAYSIGFESISVEYTKILLRFIGNAAIELIKSWNIKSEFLERYGNEVSTVGIEFPMEQILICSK